MFAIYNTTLGSEMQRILLTEDGHDTPNADSDLCPIILQNLESDQLVLLLEEVLEIPKISHCTLGLLYDTYDLGQRNADVSRDIFVE